MSGPIKGLRRKEGIKGRREEGRKEGREEGREEGMEGGREGGIMNEYLKLLRI